jgi:hypothetical protein
MAPSDAMSQQVPADGGRQPRDVAALAPLTPAGEQSLTTNHWCDQSMTTEIAATYSLLALMDAVLEAVS